MISKPLKTLSALIAISAVLAVLLVILLLMPEKKPEVSGGFLSERTINDISKIEITNKTDSYSVNAVGEGYTLADIPADSLNIEYFKMLLEESSSVSYTEIVQKNQNNAEAFGLLEPESTVSVTYKDGKGLKLYIGGTEPISGNRYMKCDGRDEIFLMKNNRTIRFTMPLKKYIDFIIVEPPVTPNVLELVKDVRFSGSAFPEPVSIKAVTKDDPETELFLISFGAASHLVTAPQLHEIDQKNCQEVFGSLVGLISEEVLEYNCNEDTLKKYGLSDPFMTVDFVYQNGKEAEAENICLKVAKYDGNYVLTKNNEGIIYRILEEPFVTASYESLIMRWFITPFILDVDSVELFVLGRNYSFDITGSTNQDMAVTENGNPLNMELFRSFYTLLLSASNDGTKPESASHGDLLYEVKFNYKDTRKNPDVVRIYAEGTRRNAVEINGVQEFMIKDSFVPCVDAAAEKLMKNEKFSSEW